MSVIIQASQTGPGQTGWTSGISTEDDGLNVERMNISLTNDVEGRLGDKPALQSNTLTLGAFEMPLLFAPTAHHG